MLDASVIDKDVDAAKFAFGIGEQVFDLRYIAQVRRVMADVAAVSGHLGDRQVGIAETIENQVGACARQHVGNPQADAAGGSGDHCCFAVELHGLLLRRCRWRRRWR
ncbi:hypothetical protein D3C72_1597950 [compost metagenome]